MVKTRGISPLKRESESIVTHLYPHTHKSDLVKTHKKLPNTPVYHHISVTTHPQGEDVIKNSQKTRLCPLATRSPHPPP